MKVLFMFLYLLICAAAVTFIFLNADKITVDYYWGSAVLSSGITVVIGFLMGLVVGQLMGVLKGRSVMKRRMMNKFQATINAAPAKPLTNVEKTPS